MFDVNAVWLYLVWIMTLSDIVDAKGIQIVNDAFNGKKLSDRYSTLKWPRQPVVTTSISRNSSL
jgi:hypothetical protein